MREEAFSTFYRQQLQPRILKMTQTRNALVKKGTMIAGIVAVIAAIAATVLFFTAPEIGLVTLAIGAVLACVIGWVSVAADLREQRTLYKNDIVRKIIAAVSDNALTYEPYRGIAESVFKATRLSGSYDRYKSEDYISGKVEKTALYFAEIHTERKVKSKNNTHWVTVFQGRMLIAEFNKHFTHNVFVLPDHLQGMLGRFGRTLQKLASSHGALVHLEDPEFERYFAVYAKDQVEARYILTPDLMRRLIHLRKRYGNGFCCAFMWGGMSLLIPSRRNLFEPPSLFSPWDSYPYHLQIFQDVAEIIALIHELNLNTRIWTKE